MDTRPQSYLFSFIGLALGLLIGVIIYLTSQVIFIVMVFIPPVIYYLLRKKQGEKKSIE
ncbi:MAG: hypothetical protein QME25_06595 [Bacteroidota bacterium]|nr:hypothetical protein [Bacteroidota bacterium]